jgi:excisionase family DNA binding protein
VTGGFHKKAERMTADSRMSDRLLTVEEAAELLRTTERFPRRLIAGRRIRFTRVGRHVRIPESAMREFIAAGLVEPIATKDKETKLWPNDDSAESGNFHRANTKHGTRGQTEPTGQHRRPSRARPTPTSG